MAMPQDAHPDILEIEAVHAGEGSGETRAHLESCSGCRALLADIDALSAAVRSASLPPFSIPPERDQAILWHARKRALRARRSAFSMWRWTGARRAAVAAATAILLALGFLFRADLTSMPNGHRAALEADVNGDGAVDILDAYALATALEAGRDTPPAADVNRDGTVDSADVDAIARRAVSLG